MVWFKFHNEILDDPRIIQLSSLQKLLFVRLMILANNSEEYGVIHFVTDEYLTKLERLTNDEFHQIKGFLKKIEQLKLIRFINEDTIEFTFFIDKQAQIAESTQRVRRHRQKQNEALHSVSETSSNVTKRFVKRNRIDKIRIEENRIDKNNNTHSTSEIVSYNVNLPEKKYSQIEDLKPEDFNQIATDYNVPYDFVVSHVDDIKNYTASTGKKYKNYLATLRNWVKRDAEKARKDFYGNNRRAIDATNL